MTTEQMTSFVSSYAASTKRIRLVTLEAAALPCGVVPGAIERDNAEEQGE